MGESATQLGRLLQLVSPGLPVGAYAYSSGLEYAVHAGWVGDEAETGDWISGVAGHCIATLDMPVLLRLYRAWHLRDLASVRRWSRFLAASRESGELLAEDRHLGIALARLLADLGIADARDWTRSPDSSWATLFSLAACRWGLHADDMLQGYLWSWCENQVAAALKLLPLGQTAGQRILLACADRLPEWSRQCQTIDDADIGQFSPRLAIGSALHAQQYSRLFRS